MTSARIISAPADGHGLTTGLLDRIYGQLQRGESAGHVVALVVLDPVGLGQRKKAKGFQRHVQLEIIRAEVVPADQEQETRLRIEDAYQARTSRGSVMHLPLGYAADEKEEQRLELREQIEKWADANGYTGAQIEERWVDYFAVGQGSDVSADWSKGSARLLMEFGASLGALNVDEENGSEGDNTSDEDDNGGPT